MIGTEFSDLHALVETPAILPRCFGGDQPDDVSGWVQKEVEITVEERNRK